jgi:hypothetical protein
MSEGEGRAKISAQSCDGTHSVHENQKEVKEGVQRCADIPPPPYPKTKREEVACGAFFLMAYITGPCHRHIFSMCHHDYALIALHRTGGHSARCNTGHTHTHTMGL